MSTSSKPVKSSPAKAMQEQSEEAPQRNEERLAVTLRSDNSYEYHLDLARSVVTALLDPEVDDCFIEVPCPVKGTKRFLHTSFIKEVDVRGL